MNETVSHEADRLSNGNTLSLCNADGLLSALFVTKKVRMLRLRKGH